MIKQDHVPDDRMSGSSHNPDLSVNIVKIRARDIMTTEVVTIRPDTKVHDIAVLLSERGISAVPVMDNGRIAGVVSEGDLIRRVELGTEQDVSGQRMAGTNIDFEKSHGSLAYDIMSTKVITVSEDTPLPGIVTIMQDNHIRRVLVTKNSRLVGIVGRSDIVRTLARRPEDAHEPLDSDDDIIRFKVIEALLGIPGASPWLTRVSVSSGIVELAGTLEDETKRDISFNAVANLPHVAGVKDRRGILQPY